MIFGRLEEGQTKIKNLVGVVAKCLVESEKNIKNLELKMAVVLSELEKTTNIVENECEEQVNNILKA